MSSAASVHPEWHGPHGESELHVLNSLTGQKVPFVPQNGRKVFWYSCGPTVYDSAHLGHARAYVTFDIVRRILQDYFRYDVFYCMNITDIDDKIILRARRNHLLEQYQKTHADKPVQVVQDYQDSFRTELEAQKAKVEGLAERVEKDPKDKDLRTNLEGERLKLGLLEQEQTAFQALLQKLGSPEQLTPDQVRRQLLDQKTPGFASVLAAHLDTVQLEKLRAAQADEFDHEIFKRHTEYFEADFMQDMERLRVLPPDSLTRVTEYVEHIRVFVQRIMENGFGYETLDGSIYFDVEAFKQTHDYAKLSPQSAGNLDLLAEGEGALSVSTMEEVATTVAAPNPDAAAGGVRQGKKNQVDFALWKASRPGEPSWPGIGESGKRGRPGWHIECSAMATHVLGERFDVHSGGEDLKFPHHDNELAQSEAFTREQQWVNHFWHAGHLNIEGLKMSKSLKNFITIQQVLEKHSPRRIRLLFLLQSWHTQMNFSDSSLLEAAAKENTLINFFQNVDVLLRNAPDPRTHPHPFTELDREYRDRFLDAQEKFRTALCDNFDYVSGMETLIHLVGETNKYAPSRSTPTPTQVVLVKRAADWMDEMLQMFGLESFRRRSSAASASTGGGSGDETEAPEQQLESTLQVLADFRDRIRGLGQQPPGGGGDGLDGVRALQQSLLQECDRLRDEILPEIGVRLEDGKPGQPAVWKLDDPKRLLAERQAKLDALADKLQSRLKQKREQLLGFQQAQRPFPELHPKQITDWDPKTTPEPPSLDEKGEPIQKSQAKRLKKAAMTARRKYDRQKTALAKALQKDPNALKALEEEITDLEKKIAELRGSSSGEEESKTQE